MNLKKKFNDILSLVGTLFLVLYGVGFNYVFTSVVNLLILLGVFSLFILYRYFMKIKPLELAMHGLVAFTALFQFIITVVYLIDMGGAYSVLFAFSRFILLFGFCAAYFFYYFFDEAKEGEKPVKSKPAKEQTTEQPAKETRAEEQSTPKGTEDGQSQVNSEIKALNSQYANGDITTEEYDQKMNDLKN